MNDDLEPRLRDALHGGSLPPAPASLLAALERVPDAPVRARTRAGGRTVIGLFAAAAILVVASAVAITGGGAPRPGPSAQTPAPSIVADVPGLRLEYTAQPVAGVAPTATEMAKMASILRARSNALGVADPTVSTHDLVLTVELPGVTDPADVETAEHLLGQIGKVEFVPLGETQATVGEPIDRTQHPPLLGGDQIASATVTTDPDGSAAIDFKLTSQGARLFGDYTTSHIGSYIAITFDGVAFSSPVILDAVPNGTVEITGSGPNGFDAQLARHVVAMIGSGELPFPIAVTSSAVIDGPSAEPSIAGSSPTPAAPVSSSRPSRLHIELAPVAPGPGDADAMQKTVAILQTRIANGGVAGATVEAQGSDRIIVELPGVTSTRDPDADLFVETGRVNLVEIHDGQTIVDVPVDPAVNPLVLAKNGVGSVTMGVDLGGNATFGLNLTTDATDAITGYAAAHTGASYAIVLDGNVLLAPVTLRDLTDDVLTLIGDRTVVDPSNRTHFQSIFAVFEGGPLPLDLKIVSSGVIIEPSPSTP